METSLTNLGDCKFNVKVNVPSNEIEDVRAEVLSEFKTLPVPGFRSGKASLDVIKFRFKKQIEARLQEKLAESAYMKVVSENALQTLGQPYFRSVNLSDTFDCEFDLFTKPEVTLAEYKNFSLPTPQVGLSVEEFSHSLMEEMRNRNGQSRPFGDDDFVQNGDSLIVDYVASVDGKEVEELRASKELLVVGKTPLGLFDQNLLGMKTGEVREFDVSAPENASANYAGKTLHFNVTLVLGSKTEPAALDDSLAQRLGMSNLSELSEKLNAVAQERVNLSKKNASVQQVAARLIENHDVKVPNWLVTTEAKTKSNFSKLDWDTLPDDQKETLLTDAEKSLKLSLVLEKVRESEVESQISDEELKNFLYTEVSKMTCSPDQKNVESVFSQLQKNGNLPVLMGKIRDEFTLNYLVNTCTFVD